jgi:hypothetical protein
VMPTWVEVVELLYSPKRATITTFESLKVFLSTPRMGNGALLKLDYFKWFLAVTYVSLSVKSAFENCSRTFYIVLCMLVLVEVKTHSSTCSKSLGIKLICSREIIEQLRYDFLVNLGSLGKVLRSVLRQST